MADSGSSSSLPALAIEATGLTKTYAASKKMPAKQALKGIDLQIPRGSVFGLLGPNGAGKSTFINILAGLVNKTSGAVKIWGIDADKSPRESRAALGVVPQEINMDPFFTPRETLELMAGFYGVPAAERRTDEILDALGLGDKKHAYVRQLSGGMKRRLMVAKAMVHAPPVLVLDEPTAGVDVELRRSLWEYVRKLNAQGVTIVLTTHYLEEAQEMCDQIAIVNHGQVIACEPTPKLLKRMNQKTRWWYGPSGRWMRCRPRCRTCRRSCARMGRSPSHTRWASNRSRNCCAAFARPVSGLVISRPKSRILKMCLCR